MIRLRWLGWLAAATSLLAADLETYPREYNQVWAMVDGGRPLDAVPGLKTLIDNHPEFFRAYRTLAHACAQTACRTDAETHFRRQRSGRLAAAAGHFGLGEIHTRRAQYRSAAHEFVACIRAAAEAHYCYTMLAYALSGDGRGRGPATDVVQFGHLDPARPETAVAKASQLHLRLKIPLAKTELLQVLPRVEQTQNREFVAEVRREATSIFSPSDSYYPQAMAALRASLDSAQAVDDRPMELDLLAVSAGSYAGTGNIETAVRNYESGIELAHSLGAKQAEGRYRELLGIDLAAAGRHQESTESYLAAAALFRELGSPGLEANALIHLGDGQKAHGDLRDAFQTYEEARRLAGTHGYKWYDAMALRGMSAISADRGEYSKALEYGEQSVRLFREVGSWSPAGAGEGMLGAYHAQLGDFDQASRSLTVSLGSARRASDAGEEARILAGLGRLADRAGRPQEALSLMQQALGVAERIGFRPYQALAHRNIAEILSASGRHPDAVAHAERAVAISREVGSALSTSEALVVLGRCQLGADRLPAARESFSTGLAIAEKSGQAPVAAEARRGLGMVAASEGDLRLALDEYRKAIDRLEAIRGALPKTEDRAGFAQERWRYYPEVIGVLGRLNAQDASAGFDKTALWYAERGRARSLFEDLLEARGAGSVRTADDSAPQPLDAAGIQRLLPGEHEAVLEYSIGEGTSFAWLVTTGGVRMVELPGRQALEEHVKRYRLLVTTRPRDAAAFAAHQTVARALYDILMRPVASGLEAIRSLTVVPDGVLHYLPFEALISTRAGVPPRYVVEDVSLNYAPSASVFGSLRRAGEPSPGSRLELLAYGDPLYGRGSTSAPASVPNLVRRAYESSGARFPALPNTRVEVDRIGAMFPPSRTRLRFGKEASEDSVKRDDLRAYRRIHFATHAVLDERFPRRSGIVLSLVDTGREDGILQMGEVLKLRLDADLVVLSGCQTGLGRLVRGEGVVGLTRAFLYAGARRAAVTLWEASDTATADLMQDFYRGMRDGEAPGGALRAAKLRMLHSRGTAYRHPYYWAGFVLAGLN